MRKIIIFTMLIAMLLIPLAACQPAATEAPPEVEEPAPAEEEEAAPPEEEEAA